MAKKKVTRQMTPKRRGERKIEVVDRTGTLKKFEPSTAENLREYAAAGAIVKGKVPDNLPVRDLDEGEKDLVVAVFANHHRNMVLRVAVHNDGWTDYLCLEQGIIDLQQMTTEEFHEFYFNRYPSYPISEAIRHFTNPKTPGIIVSDEARQVMGKINLNAVAPKNATNPRKEKKMTIKNNDAATDDNDNDSEDSAPNKRSKKKSAAKSAPVSKKKSAAKSAPVSKKKSAAKNDDSDRGGRTSPHAGKKIKVLTKELGARPGSLREAIRTAVIKAKKVDDVMGQTVSAGDKEAIITGTVISNMIAAGIIAVE